MLRQTAMNQNRRLVEVAESVLSMAEYLPSKARLSAMVQPRNGARTSPARDRLQAESWL